MTEDKRLGGIDARIEPERAEGESPPRLGVVFIKEDGDQARLWSVIENHGSVADNDIVRTFDVTASVTD